MVWYCALTGMHLWHSDYGPFLRDTQLDLCRRLITVPLSTFHRLAELIGDPKGELIFLFSTARCGSTLLTQVVRKNVDNPHGSSRTIFAQLSRHMHRGSSRKKYLGGLAPHHLGGNNG